LIWHHVLCIGDSQTAGARAPCGWPELLNLVFHRRHPETAEWVGLNHGVSGDTSVMIWRRLMAILAPNRHAHVAVFLMGANDARDLFPLDVSESCFRSCLVLARTMEVLPVALIPARISAKRGHITGAAGAGGYTSRAAERLVEIREVQLRSVHDLDVVSLDLDQVVGPEHYVDAVHFSHEGQLAIAEAVSDLLVSI
jgi:lysophospholipase L1-like esterase